MGEVFVELGAEGVNHLVENHWDRGYDKLHSAVTGKSKPDDRRKRNHRNELPSPELDRDNYAAQPYDSRFRGRESSLERESETSERVIGKYENEPDDPPRPVESVLSRSERRRDKDRMAQLNGYAPPQRGQSYDPPRHRAQDDDDSDYDDRSGRRHRGSRGYEDDRDRDWDHEREVTETERYKGPAGGGRTQQYRPDSYRSDNNRDTYTATGGAVTQYRRSQGDLTDYQSRRSRSRGRNDRYDRDRSYSRDRGSENNWREKLDETFDTSMQGLGVGVAGAVIGGLAGRQFGNKHKNRDILLGAVVGGLASNIAENKYRDWRENKERDDRGDRYDHRSKSAMR